MGVLDQNSDEFGISQEQWAAMSVSEQDAFALEVEATRAAESDVLHKDRGEDKYGYPDPPVKDSIFRFFRQIILMKDSRKTGNVTKQELGNLRLTIRSYANIANFCKLQGLGVIEEWSRRKAEVTLATSLSKDGFLPKLFVTQIKAEKKVSGDRVFKKSLFGGTKEITPKEEGADVYEG